MSVEVLQIMGQLVLSMVLGGIIGAERENLHKAAGVRTLALVSMGAALFTVLSLNIEGGDITRIASQIVTGIGFIGAGIIIFDQHKVQGLTTAAALWATAAVGMTVGFGMYAVAILTTFMILIVLYGMRKLNLDEKIEGKKRKR